MSAADTLREECASALLHPNVQAFLRVIRQGETSQEADAYRWIVGSTRKAPQLVDTFADHPRRRVFIPSLRVWSTAAGAYQFLQGTWDECARALGLTDFGPASQDLAAVFLIRRRGALPALLAGDIEGAIAKCAAEWASLPGSPYGQPVQTLLGALSVYRHWRGPEAAAPDQSRSEKTEAPAPTPSPPPEKTPTAPAPQWPTEDDLQSGRAFTHPQEPTPMAPFIAAGLSALIQNAPALIRVFGDSPQAEKNAKAAEAVAAIAMKATGETTVEGAVKAMEASPEKAAAYREAVHQSMGELLSLMAQAVDIDEKTRATALDRNLTLGTATGGRWLWLLGGTAGAMVLFSFAITWQVLFGEREFSEGVKMLLLGQIVMAGFGLVMAFMFGTNLQNRVSQQNAREQQ